MTKGLLRKQALLTGHRASVFALAQGQSEQHLLSGAGEGWVVEWDLRQPELGKVIAQVEGNIFALHYLPQSRHLLAGTMHGGLHWIDLDDPSNTLNIAHHRKGLFAFLQLGEFLFTAGGDGFLTRWSIAERKRVESLQLSTQSLRCLAFHEQRRELAIGASDHQIYLLDADTLKLKSTIEKAHSNSVFCLTYHPDGKKLYSGGRDAMLRTWDLNETPKMAKNIAAHMYTINDMLWHPQGHLLFTASRDKTIKVWDSESLELLKVVEPVRDSGHLNSVNRLHWQANHLISASDDRTVGIWSIGNE